MVGLFFYGALFLAWNALPFATQVGIHIYIGFSQVGMRVVNPPSTLGPLLLNEEMEKEVQLRLQEDK